MLFKIRCFSKLVGLMVVFLISYSGVAANAAELGETESMILRSLSDFRSIANLLSTNSMKLNGSMDNAGENKLLDLQEIPNLKDCNREMQRKWINDSWLEPYRIEGNESKPIFGFFSPFDGSFTCVVKSFYLYAIDAVCPNSSVVKNSGEVSLIKMEMVEPKNCLVLQSRMSNKLRGNFMTIQKKTFKIGDEGEVELCYKLAGSKDGISGVQCPNEEMRKARIPPRNFYYVRKDQNGKRKSFFVSPSWGRYKELIKVRHLSLVQYDQYDYSHEYDGSGYEKD